MSCVPKLSQEALRKRGFLLMSHSALFWTRGVAVLKSVETSKEDTSVSILREAYPQRVSLTVVEVTWTLFGSSTHSDTQTVRKMLLRGQLVPNLAKVGGRWVIPIVALGRALDDLQQVPIGKPPVWLWPRASACPRRAPPTVEGANRRAARRAIGDARVTGLFKRPAPCSRTTSTAATS